MSETYLFCFGGCCEIHIQLGKRLIPILLVWLRGGDGVGWGGGPPPQAKPNSPIGHYQVVCVCVVGMKMYCACVFGN